MYNYKLFKTNVNYHAFRQNTIIYVEKKYNPEINEYINAHLDEIRDLFKKIEAYFFYFPRYDFSETLSYINPYYSNEHIALFNNDIENKANTEIYKLLKEKIKGIFNIKQGLIFYYNNFHDKKRKGLPKQYFIYFKIKKNKDILEQIKYFCENIYTRFHDEENIKFLTKLDEPTPYYSTKLCQAQDIDETERKIQTLFREEMNKVAMEIQEKTTLMLNNGYINLLINHLPDELIKELQLKVFVPENKLSKLIITDDFRFLLPDYLNIEITLSSLAKAVYILFLRHEKGIYLKRLFDYKNELFEIYKLISNRENIQDLNESIEAIVNPLNNSIHEKCSMIKRAFHAHMYCLLAEQYFITGERSKIKEILLPRNLVTLPESLNQIPKTITINE